MKHPVSLLAMLFLVACARPAPRGSSADPTVTAATPIRAVYLVQTPGQLTTSDLQAHPEVIVANSFSDFQEHAKPGVALWIDKNAKTLIEDEWLDESPQMYYPIVLVGFNDPYYSFALTLRICCFTGVIGIDWSAKELEPGFSVIQREGAQGQVSGGGFLQGYHQVPRVEDILKITNALLDGTWKPTATPIRTPRATLTPLATFTRAPGGIASGGTTVTPRVPPPTPYVTFTPGPGGRSAPGGIAVTPRPSATPFPITGKEPPACTFPLAQTTTAESAAETYSFSDPKSVPLNSSWSEISLYRWLPDNQRLLVGHKDNVDYDDFNRVEVQNIGLYNPRTGESQDFGSRVAPGYPPPPPVWIPSLKAVVYPESIDLTPRTLREDGQGWLPLASADFQRRIWFSRGDPAHLQTLVDEPVTVTYDRPSKFGEDFTVVASPDGSEIVYLDTEGRQLYEQRVVQGAFQSVPAPAFDATQWVYRPDMLTGWYMAWRPNSRQVFLYTRGHPVSSSYTFLLDVSSGAVCELNLWTDDPKDWRKSWVRQVHWSPNGRYLAVVRMKGSGYKDDGFGDLIVLDTATGKLCQIKPTQLSPAGVEREGQHFVVDMGFVIDAAWAPDNRHLAAIGQAVYWTSGSRGTQSAERLFLLDFLTGQAVQVSSAELAPNIDRPREYLLWSSDDALLWSSDGSQLIMPAPRGLYLLSVQKRAQP